MTIVGRDNRDRRDSRDRRERADVAVLGGGPAGACCAAKLAELGVSVVFFQKAETARQHTGESLPSSARVLLDALGVELPQGVLVERPPEHLVYWGDIQGGGAPAEPAHEASFLVWRGPFDEALRERATANGARCVESVVREVSRANDGIGYDVRTTDGATLGCRFVVDASGRAGVLSRPLRRREPGFRTTALTAHFKALPSTPATMVEAFADGYVWTAPLRDGLRDVTVVSEPGQPYGAALEACEQIHRFVDRDRQTDTVRGIDATPYWSERFCEADALRCGDAASFLDPLSAHGLHKAMDSGLVGAIVARTILERPESASDAASFYNEREGSIYKVTAERLGRLYAAETRFRDRPFWSARRLEPPATEPEPPRAPLRPDMKLRPGHGVELVDAPVLAGDFIERQPVLSVPGHERPVRFLGAVSLPELYRGVVRLENVAVAARAAPASFDTAYRAIDWLYRSGYLIE